MKGKKILAFLLALTLCLSLAACSGGGDYAGYAAAFQKTTEQKGFDTDFQLQMKINGEDHNSDGNLKMDSSSGTTYLLCKAYINGKEFNQFSDGTAVYTDDGASKTKYTINQKDQKPNDSEKSAKDNADTDFDIDAFASDFSSFLEVGKIKEMGLLDPIPEKYITQTKSGKSGDDTLYEFTIADSLLQILLNTMIAGQMQNAGNPLKFSAMKDFGYTAVETDGCISQLYYKGTTTVTVPADYMADGVEANYDINFTLAFKYNNPGQAVSITLPSTDGYV